MAPSPFFARSLFVLSGIVSWKDKKSQRILHHLENDRELFHFPLVVIFVVYLFSRRNAHQYDRKKPPVSGQAVDRTGKKKMTLPVALGRFFCWKRSQQ
jgi:hypothetical protein